MIETSTGMRFGCHVDAIILGEHPHTGEPIVGYKLTDRRNGALLFSGIEVQSKYREVIERQMKLLGWVVMPTADDVTVQEPPKGESS